MAKLVKDKILPTLIHMAVPMLAGTIALNAYNLADTWFVSRLGTQALAAMSFTFPVVMLLTFVIRGLATGAMTLVAHALGKGSSQTAARITTHAAFLSFIIALCFTFVGLLTITPLFIRLGATGEVLFFVKQYMVIWYCGLVLLSLHILFADIIIATGNTKIVSFLMFTGTVFNCVLDPLLIFGLWGFPVMGICGAALATVIAEGIVLVGAFYFIHRKYNLFLFGSHSYRRIMSSWRNILHIGIPSVLSSILTPVSNGIIVRIISGFGESAVAAVGVAVRIEMFAFMIPMTVGISLVPFIGQNYGAKRFDRIRTANKGTTIFALIFGLFMAIIFLFITRSIAGLFSNDSAVIDVLVQYIYITCFGYGFLEMHRYATFSLTGIHKPLSSTLLHIIRVIVFLIPLVYLGAYFFGFPGVCWARLISDVGSGIIGVVYVRIVLQKFVLQK